MMRCFLAVVFAVLVTAALPHRAEAQCSAGLIVNCPFSNTPQPDDVLLGWQSGQNPHTRKFPVFAIGQAINASLFSRPPPIGNVIPNTGTFTGLSQTISTAWVGGYPGANPAMYSTQTYTGTPTGGFVNSSGTTIPFNLVSVTGDEINWTTGGGVADYFIKGVFGGGSASGGRSGLVVDVSQTGATAAPGDSYGGIQVYASVFANVTGATSGAGNGRGSWNGIGADVGHLQANIWVHEITGMQIGLSNEAPTSSTDYLEFVKWVDGAPSTWNAYAFSAFETYSQVNGHYMKYGLTLGDPQSGEFSANGFPFTTTSTFIYAFTGNLGVGIDMSSVTFTTAFLKGPNGFQVLNNNWVFSDAIHGAQSNVISLLNADAGTAMFAAEGHGVVVNHLLTTAGVTGTGVTLASVGTDTNVSMVIKPQGSGFVAMTNAAGQSVMQFLGVGNAVNFFAASSEASGTAPILQTQGADATVGFVLRTAAGAGEFQFWNAANNVEAAVAGVLNAASYPMLTAAASGPIKISVGGTAANMILGTGVALATNAATGDILIPTSAGVPSATTGGLGQAAIRIDTVSHKICHSEGGGTWYDATGAACS